MRRNSVINEMDRGMNAATRLRSVDCQRNQHVIPVNESAIQIPLIGMGLLNFPSSGWRVFCQENWAEPG